jgi:uncharacterized membrane protein (DUF373 family)
MSSEIKENITPRWKSSMEMFERFIVAALALLLVLIVAIILAVVAYLFARKLGVFVTNVETIAELQQAALQAFSGILLVLLGLELLETVKVYFREHSVRVEVILLVSLIAMGRQVLEIDLHHIDLLILFGFSSLLLALAVSYFLVKRAQFSAPRSRSMDAKKRHR